MAGDEAFVMIAATVVCLFVWGFWLMRLWQIYSPRCPGWHRAVLTLGPLACLVTLAWAVSRYDSAEVRENGWYIFLFTAVGAVTLRLTLPLLNVLGLDVPGQAVAQRNAAALPAVVGAWLAATALNIGANIGEGDTIYTALGPLVLASALLAGFALAAVALTGASTAITSGREPTAGIRFGTLLLSASLPLARAASGDWISVEASCGKFAAAIPLLLVLLALGWLAGKIASGQKGWLQAGVLPAGIFLIVAAAIRT
jgi:hypothetical protein